MVKATASHMRLCRSPGRYQPNAYAADRRPVRLAGRCGVRWKPAATATAQGLGLIQPAGAPGQGRLLSGPQLEEHPTERQRKLRLVGSRRAAAAGMRPRALRPAAVIVNRRKDELPPLLLHARPGLPGNHRRRGVGSNLLRFCLAADWEIIVNGQVARASRARTLPNGWHATFRSGVEPDFDHRAFGHAAASRQALPVPAANRAAD
jgi:hypothetical protein